MHEGLWPHFSVFPQLVQIQLEAKLVRTGIGIIITQVITDDPLPFTKLSPILEKY